MKKLKLIFFIILLCIIVTGCKDEHVCSEYSSDWISEEDISCTKEVKQIKKCTKCDEILETRNYIQEHVLKENIIKETSCSNEGIKKVTCDLCDYEETITLPKTDHSLKETVIQELTCTVDGIVKYTCEKCSYEETITLPKTDHSLKETVIQELTCTVDGIVKYTCEKCSYEETKTTKSSGHTEVAIPDVEASCSSLGLKGGTKCSKCEEILVIPEIISTTDHDYEKVVIQELTCSRDGIVDDVCKVCNTSKRTITPSIGHIMGTPTIKVYPTVSSQGEREFKCQYCEIVMKTQKYVDNGYYKNGKLSVNGRDLVNQYGQKFQLYGLSTHGMQWFGRYANFNTIASIQEGFGNNVIRFAMYTAEDGYCDGSESRKKQMLEDLYEGIDAATKLGLYVIVDWHMVGAESVADKNPLTYLKESKEFFSMVSEKYKDQDNILYEIMNEPNGSTTWEDCKKYAEAVIPCIRKNSDGIILVGNPKWTADLTSVMKNPLVGYTNIMYTYHFYAADHTNTSQVVKAYDSGFPVFISEFGFMESSGDGAISETNGNKWKQVLDSRNISYVAWNISNSKGAASIFKYQSSDMTSVADSNLKEWGIYLKNWYRAKSLTEKLDEEVEEELKANIELMTEVPEWTTNYECFIVSSGADDSRLNYDWTSTNTSILTISEYSTLKIIGNGKCSIICKHKTNGEVGILDVELKDGKVVSYTSRYVE